MRLTFLVLSVALCSAPVLGQKCELTLEQSPELRGFKLGMTTAQAQKQLAGVAFKKPNQLGKQFVYFAGSKLKSRGSDDTRSVIVGSLTFLDGRLMMVTINYDDSVKWEGIDEFVFKASQSLGLPPAWPMKKGIEDDGEYGFAWRELACVGFTIKATFREEPAYMALELKDARYTDLLYERQRELEERKKARFKP